jgi:rhamnosyl/mannosyltransferase
LEVDDCRKFQIIDSCHVYLLPSVNQSEAFGISQVEAMAFGLPSISSDLSNGVNFVNPHKFSGLNVLKCSPEAIAESVLEITSNAFVYSTFSGNAITNSRRFTISSMQSSFLSFL